MKETYEPPRLIEVGSLKDLTLGGGRGGRDDLYNERAPFGPVLS
jgi:hypothetical protein